jgi:mannose-1-phosphate guanylyltransferase/mannose-6-phosphate isomerase
LPRRGGGDGFVVSGSSKPEAEDAAQYVANGYLWNSGNFMFRGGFCLRISQVRARQRASCRDRGRAGGTDRFVMPRANSFRAARSLGRLRIMEKASRAVVLPVSFGWSDVGSWRAVWNLRPRTQPAPPPAVRRCSSTPNLRQALVAFGTSKIWS